MTRDDLVVHIHTPWTHGLGRVVGVNEIGWLEVHWANGDSGAYQAQHLEHANKWQHDQVEKATRR